MKIRDHKGVVRQALFLSSATTDDDSNAPVPYVGLYLLHRAGEHGVVMEDYHACYMPKFKASHRLELVEADKKECGELLHSGFDFLLDGYPYWKKEVAA